MVTTTTMTIDQSVRAGVAFLGLRGRLTIETELLLRDAVHKLIESGQTRIVFNLAEVPSIDSCGLGTIAQACVSTRRRGGDVKLAQVPDRILRLLVVTKLLTVVDVYESEDEAARSMLDEGPLRIVDSRRLQRQVVQLDA